MLPMKKGALATVLMLMLFVSLGVSPLGQANAAVTATVQLTGTLKAEVIGVLNERVANGTRIAAVVRLTNSSSKLVKVPDYELRAKTTAGITYALKSSSANKATIQPKESVDLNYMTVITRKDAITVSKLAWIKVDAYVYPKKETLVKELAVSSLVWSGDGSVLADKSLSVAWGKAFKIPSLTSSLEYAPTRAYTRSTPSGAVTILTLRVKNNGKWQEKLPEFLVSGVASNKAYLGSRVGEESVILEPGEEQNIYYAIPTDSGANLMRLNVLIPERFIDEAGRSTSYSIGRLSIQLPQSAALRNPAAAYTFDTPIQFDNENKRIREEIDVSLADLQLYKGEGNGYKIAVAKFKINNRGSLSVPLPDFVAEIVSEDGVSYDGVRQAEAPSALNPNLGTVISYFFVVPESENQDGLTLNLLDAGSAAPYVLPIASITTEVKQYDGSAFYPYTVHLSKSSSMQLNGSNSESSLSVTLAVDVSAEEQMVVNRGFSSMKLELYSPSEGVVDSAYLAFTGADRLISGKRTVRFELPPSMLSAGSLSLRVYESFDTPAGEANRLTATIPM
ncbi:hypothetical protein COLU111180_00955 [Cohnella lubricantis]|uniref:Uncharacterized protein n=1 Tax=Cohnella lubricantis TaxID=2163172 RepID=A0A841T682_9BACL|nr:hypothetical protein [Cohnella lubricantis]MBB6676834.1 hypothetical protein [Cohnella lubricantis]MBP2119414.1 hypothetical protein [Cohnella lubricantis]